MEGQQQKLTKLDKIMSNFFASDKFALICAIMDTMHPKLDYLRNVKYDIKERVDVKTQVRDIIFTFCSREKIPSYIFIRELLNRLPAYMVDKESRTMQELQEFLREFIAEELRSMGFQGNLPKHTSETYEK